MFSGLFRCYILRWHPHRGHSCDFPSRYVHSSTEKNLLLDISRYPSRWDQIPDRIVPCEELMTHWETQAHGTLHRHHSYPNYHHRLCPTAHCDKPPRGHSWRHHSPNGLTNTPHWRPYCVYNHGFPIHDVYSHIHETHCLSMPDRPSKLAQYLGRGWRRCRLASLVCSQAACTLR